jgi:threonine dehydrogenase-like Zn-dependent dehydrogenase
MSEVMEIPVEHKALVLDSYPPKVQTVPTPKAGPGSALVRVLTVNVLSYAKDVYSGKRSYPFPKPLIIGSSGVGRVVAAGSDATTIKPGQLVLFDSLILGRDDPSVAILHGLYEGTTDASRTLMRGEWRDSTYAEYAKLPLENLQLLDEKRFLGSQKEGGLEYSIEDLVYLTRLVVPYGGLRDIDVKPGETIIIAPATGSFGGAAVRMALAMGARVIGMGRNKDALARIAASNQRTEIVPMTGDMQADLDALQAFGTIDAYFDISPPQAAKSTHVKSCILALRQGGRVSLMGGQMEDVPLPISVIMTKSLKVQGKFMYEKQDLKDLVKMTEIGVLNLKNSGAKVRGVYALEEWEKAFDEAEAGQAGGERVLFAP